MLEEHGERFLRPLSSAPRPDNHGPAREARAWQWDDVGSGAADAMDRIGSGLQGSRASVLFQGELVARQGQV